MPSTTVGSPITLHILVLVSNIAVIISDILAFLEVIRQIWGLWREKQNHPLQSIQTVIDRLHGSIIADMGERTDQVDVETSLGEEDHGQWTV
ncbi:hypothetical protein Clacol_004372 [Clathrus columnatus]|uniref:Uncharacterized protein n=1 Tax=Clathrus columnatus TaxID=1419009 RepID=A0AAV5ACC4_9AGAM|nr:hypothetical protein Clacol_004372 [Clathrus columnatus]